MSLHPTVDNTDHIQGNRKAVITIVEYGDYECPYCGAAYPILKNMMRQYSHQLRFVFRNFPLSEIHPYARVAALAAEAAAVQGRFWEMHDAIFEHQQELSEPFLLQLATQLGLDTAQFNKDMQSKKLGAIVDRDFESGMRSGVNGTPTFFINGQKFDGDAENLLDLLQANALRA